jgi:DNA replication protein DnaC
MCLPLAAVATIAVVSSVASGAAAAYGSYQQGQAGKAMNDYQAAVAGQQAVLAQRNADENSTIASVQGAADSQVAARKAAQVAGSQAAAEAANGTAGSVTSSDVKLDTFDTAKLDQQNIQYNTQLKQWGYQNQNAGEQFDLASEANQDKIAGSNAALSGDIGVGTSLLSTASQVANTSLQAKYYSGLGIK